MRRNVLGAKRDVEKTQAAIAEAMEEAAAEMAAAVASGSPVPASGAVRRARDAERGAGDRITVMEAALIKLNANRALCQRDAEAAAADVQRAAASICAVPARRLLDKAEKLRDELVPLVGLLAGLFASEVRAPAGTHYPSDDDLKAVRSDAARLLGSLAHLGTVWQRAPDGSAWRAALDALARDPDADTVFE